MDQHSEYLWLKQSVTFTVNGQTRTVEIAVPLRPGATADEVEALLSEADAGMERISRHLDERVAAISGSPAPARVSAGPEAAPNPPAQPRAPTEPEPTRPAANAPRHATEATTPSQPIPPAASLPTRSTSPASAPARPAQAPAAPPTASRPPQPSRPAAQSQGELSRPEFIALLKDMELDVRQAMQKLGVRSLEGLNLREALEALRRQTLRSGQREAPTGEPAPAAPIPISSRPAPRRQEQPHFDEEEDEPDMTFSVAPDDEPDEDLPYTLDVADAWNGEDDLDDLDDVPDFGPPPASRRAPPHGRTLPPVASPARGSSSGTLTAPGEPLDPTPSGDRARVTRLLARLRAAQGGGSLTTQQRTAYRNIVVQEIGETTATSLVRGVWRLTPERLGPEQMDELLSWGKQDTFSDDAQLVLAELRAERERATASEPGQNGATKPPAPRARPRSASAPDPTGGE